MVLRFACLKSPNFALRLGKAVVEFHGPVGGEVFRPVLERVALSSFGVLVDRKSVV